MRKARVERRSKGAPLSLREQRSMLCENLNFTAAESYKQLRANLLFAMPDEKRCRIVGVTSSIRGEGKSTSAINLAYTLAETGKRVLLIDADMRLPSVAKKLAAASKPGLSNLLAGLSTEQEAIHASSLLDNWDIMPAGDIPPNPSELLGSEQMGRMLSAVSERYDFIVVDLPPVDIVSDALVIARWVSGIIVVVRANYTDRRSVAECMRQLGVLKSKVLGFTVTGVAEHHKEYGKYRKKYYGYGYDYGYGYGYGASSGAGKKAAQVKDPADAAQEHVSAVVRQITEDRAAAAKGTDGAARPASGRPRRSAEAKPRTGKENGGAVRPESKRNDG